MPNITGPSSTPGFHADLAKALIPTEAGGSDYGQDLPHGCPPLQAIVGPKLLFRLVQKQNFDEADFRTTREEGTFVFGDPCQRCAISTQSTKDGARRMKRLVPNLADRHIAEGVVPANGGALLHTPTNNSRHHWSWWPRADIFRHSYFQLLDEAA